MRILYLSSVFPRPGAVVKGIYNYYLCKVLSQSHDVTVVSPWRWWRRLFDAWGGEDDATSRNGATRMDIRRPTFYYLPKVLRSHYDWFMWQSVRRSVGDACRDRKPDFILSYWTHPDGGAALRAGRAMSVPVVLRVGGSDILLELKKPERRKAFLSVLQSVDLILPVGRHLHAALLSEGIDAAKVHLLYEGVDKERFSPGDKQQSRTRLGLPLNLPVLLWVGNFVPVKGLDVLLQACSLLKDTGTEFCLALIGSGPLRKWLIAEVHSRGLSGSVRIVGAVLHDTLPDWYRSADLTVLPSLSEGIPNVLNESIACGTPFVASSVGGIPDMATEPIDRLVPPRDPAALAAAIRDKLSSGESSAPRSFVPYAWADVANSLIEAVTPLLARKSA